MNEQLFNQHSSNALNAISEIQEVKKPKTESKKQNVLVVHELGCDTEDVVVYELPNNEEEAAQAAKSFFLQDVEEEKENSSDIDESNTYWDDDAQCGQIRWLSLDLRDNHKRATYDVASITKR